MPNFRDRHRASFGKPKEKSVEEGKTEVTKIYAFITNHDAKHPITDEKAYEATAVTNHGEVVTSFIAGNIIGLKEAAKEYSYPTTFGNPKLVWVDSPEDHPVVSKFYAKLFEGDVDEARAPASTEELMNESLVALRDEHHLCSRCLIRNVCAIATNPVAEQAKIVVSACQFYVPKGDEE